MNWVLLIQILTVAAQTFVLITLMYQAKIAYAAWKETSIERERAREESKRAKVHDRITEWINYEFSVRRSRIYKVISAPTTSRADIIDKWQNDEDFRATSNRVLNFLEALAQGIDDKILDEKAAKRFFRPIACPYFEMYKELVKYIREQGKDPTIFSDIETLVKKWGL